MGGATSSGQPLGTRCERRGEALEEKKRAVLREALQEGIAELDAGQGVETSPEELMAEVDAELGLGR